MQTVTDLQNWIGKEQTRTAIIDHRQAELMAVTLGHDIPQMGDALPGLWHWSWFNDALPASELGRDGHPKKGGFIPPVPLPRRMWAGGKVEFLSSIEIGRECTKRSIIKDIQEKNGRSGALCIVTIEHQISDEEKLCIRETQNLVYREDPDPDAPKASPPQPPQNPELTEVITPDPVLMFRYSALTFNGHRIHYDVDYAREIEGYKGLVFHAPLTATLLLNLAQKLAGNAPIKEYSYRATSPLFCNDEIRLCGRNEDGKLLVWAENPSGHQAMIAEASV